VSEFGRHAQRAGQAPHDIVANMPEDEVTGRRTDNNWAEISGGKATRQHARPQADCGWLKSSSRWATSRGRSTRVRLTWPAAR
jgi:hypothetical protein